jgi:release factor glutamine methyltransferase
MDRHQARAASVHLPVRVYFEFMGDDQPASGDVWTISRLLRWTTDYLGGAGVDEPRLSAELLLAHALGWAKIELYTRFDHQPSSDERASLRELVRRAARHEPIAYLVGHKEFYSLDLEVTPDVLIPRPETETLVEQAIACCRAAEGPEVTLLDMGTGSGCIAITVLSQVPEARAVGSDISAAALEVAGRNARRHNVADRLRLVEADRLNLPADCVPEGGFDLIVSNPPYIADGDLAALPANVREYEPQITLSAGEDGLAFYRALQADGPGLVAPGGTLLVEIGAGSRDAVAKVMQQDGLFEHVGTYRDPGGAHDRVMQFRVQPQRAARQ